MKTCSPLSRLSIMQPHPQGRMTLLMALQLYDFWTFWTHCIHEHLPCSHSLRKVLLLKRRQEVRVTCGTCAGAHCWRCVCWLVFTASVHACILYTHEESVHAYDLCMWGISPCLHYVYVRICSYMYFMHAKHHLSVHIVHMWGKCPKALVLILHDLFVMNVGFIYIPTKLCVNFCVKLEKALQNLLSIAHCAGYGTNVLWSAASSKTSSTVLPPACTVSS